MWTYNNIEVTEPPNNYISFVYLITRTNLNEDEISPIYYIGKKNFFNSKGLETDWEDYYGSSEWLLSDVKKYGKESFKREIIHFCESTHQATYLELKEQINNNVLYVDENGYSLYYNQAIFNKFSVHYEDFESLDEETAKLILENQEVFNSKIKKVWINNGNYNKKVSEYEAKKKVGKYNWVYGRMKKKVIYNNGKMNKWFFSDDKVPKEWTKGAIRRFFNNGVEQKKVLIDEIQFLDNTWIPGKLINKIWINDGEYNFKIDENLLEYYVSKGYIRGRINNYNKNTKILYKDGEYKTVHKNNLFLYLEDGWVIKGKSQGSRYYCHNNVVQKWFKTRDKRDLFIDKNKEFKIGQLPRDEFTTKNIVLVKEINTDEESVVTKEEYEKLKYIKYVTRKTKKVKIYSDNKEIFIGYLNVFLLKHNYKEIYFRTALRGNNKVIVKKGSDKDKKINDLNYTIFWA